MVNKVDARDVRQLASSAAPMPRSSNAKPKKNPDNVPILPGTSSYAYTKIVENTEATIRPDRSVRLCSAINPYTEN